MKIKNKREVKEELVSSYQAGDHSRVKEIYETYCFMFSKIEIRDLFKCDYKKVNEILKR